MPSVKVTCFNCGKDLEFPGLISRGEDCPHCHFDVHVCKNCEFWDRSAYNECREPAAERVVDKDRSNFCDQFQPKQGGVATGQSRDHLMSAAEALFKKKS